MRTINKYFKNKKYQIVLHISLYFLWIGISPIHLYYPDERNGEKISFQKGISCKIPFLELNFIKHIK